MNANYIEDKDLTEDEARAQEEWNRYARTVEENERKARMQNRITAVLSAILLALILFFVFCGKLLIVAFM